MPACVRTGREENDTGNTTQRGVTTALRKLCQEAMPEAGHLLVTSGDCRELSPPKACTKGVTVSRKCWEEEASHKRRLLTGA